MTVKIGIILFVLLSGFYLGIKVEGWRGAALRERIMVAEEKLRQERLLTNAMIGELAAVREEKARVVYKRIIERIPQLVPADACHLPSGWRLLHDAAAMRSDSPAGPVDHVATVPAADAARTVAENYEAHHRTADRLEDCQRYIRDVVQPEGMTQ